MSTLDEKRSIQRQELQYYLQIFNQVTHKPIGSIVNISAHGMMLVSQKRLLTHALFQLEMKLPSINKKRPQVIHFEALSHWCKPDITPDCFDTGFSFTKPNPELIEVVEALTDYFSFKPYNL